MEALRRQGIEILSGFESLGNTIWFKRFFVEILTFCLGGNHHNCTGEILCIGVTVCLGDAQGRICEKQNKQSHMYALIHCP